MKIGERLGAAAVVLLVTATVWVAADRSLLRTSPEMAAKVVVNCEDPNYRVRVVKPVPSELRVKFVGPGRAIDKLLTDQSRVVCRFSLSAADAERAAEAGQLVFRPRDGLAWLAEEGVTLDECVPQEVVAKVDRVQRIQVRVDLMPKDKEQVDDGYEVDPPEVSAIVADSALARIGQQQWWAAPELDLRSLQLRSGLTDTQTARLIPSTGEDPDIVFEPPQVKVRKLRHGVRPQRKTFEERIPVRPLGLISVLREYDIEVEPAEISGLTVFGPPSEVEGLSAEDVWAVLVLTAQDRPNPEAPIPRQLEIHFPGRERVKVDGEPPRVNFTLKRRAAPLPQ